MFVKESIRNLKENDGKGESLEWTLNQILCIDEMLKIGRALARILGVNLTSNYGLEIN